MSRVKKRRKRRVRLKKKNFLIFCLVILLIIFITSKGVNFIFSIFEEEDNEYVESTISNKNNVNKDKYINDPRLKELNNIDKEISYFNYDYLDRYIAYKEKHPDMDDDKIVLYVNIGIDNDYYTNTRKSINLNRSTILVNKYNFLDKRYVPRDLQSISTTYARSGMQLVKEAKNQFEAMAKDASKENLKIIVMSSYRSYDYQEKIYNKYVKTDGKEAADTYSGRPGFSEHQTGLAIDVYNGKIDYMNFEKTEEFKWMQNNAYKYGFILRFPKDKDEITGYQYESWHYRYVGKEIAQYIHDSGITFEEYYVKYIETY